MQYLGTTTLLLLLFAACLRTEAFSCNFDKDTCGFTQRVDDDFDWTRHQWGTPSQGTGPGSDHTTLRGYYMYIEASGKKNGNKAVLERNVDINSDNSCLMFYYHMNGFYVGTLNVYLGQANVFSKTANQGAGWKMAKVLLPTASRGRQMLKFEGITGKGFQGDIAIDDVSVGGCIGEGTIPPPLPSATTPVVVPPTTIRPGPPIPPGSCGIRPNTRIVGGTSSNHGDWPWQAQLKSSPGFSPFCGGSLIHPQWILTASHCVSGSKAIKTIVRLGAHRRSAKVGTEQDFKIVKVITHPSYHKPLRYSNDIALLKLERPAKLNRFVSLVCLPDTVSLPTDGTKCWITGWGRTHGPSPDYLQQASVPIVSERRCRFAYMGQIHDSMICAGLDQGGIDSCQGDSGGPMVCENGGRFYVQGATSWGSGCGKPGKFGVYAKVKYELDWIRSEINKG